MTLYTRPWKLEIRKRERLSVVDIKTLQKRRLFWGVQFEKSSAADPGGGSLQRFLFRLQRVFGQWRNSWGLFCCQQFISSPAASLFVRHQTFNGTFPQLEIYWGQQKKVALREPKFRGANVELLGRQFSNQAILPQWIFFLTKKVPKKLTSGHTQIFFDQQFSDFSKCVCTPIWKIIKLWKRIWKVLCFIMWSIYFCNF